MGNCRKTFVVVVALAVVLVSASCGGGGGGSPTEPPAPTVPQVSGLWAGTSELVAFRPGGDCVADAMNNFVIPLFAQPFPITWSVTQSGGNLNVVQNNSQTAWVHQFSGSIGSNGAISLAGSWNGTTFVGNVRCVNGELWALWLVDGSTGAFSGGVAAGGNGISGEFRAQYAVASPFTGVHSRFIEGVFNMNLTRQ